MENTLLIADERLIKLTESAFKKASNLLARDPAKGYLRVKITGGGCNGLSYELKLVEAIEPLDLIVNCDKLKVLVDSKSALYLKGTLLDYSNKMIGGGFKFFNPNAKTSCSCGESFNV